MQQEPTIDTSLLNKKEADLFNTIIENNGVLIIKNKENMPKSYNCKSISDNVFYNSNPLKFIDLRLSQVDEVLILDNWLLDEIKEPCLINLYDFEYCSQEVEKLVFEILSKRTFNGIKIPDHVFFIISEHPKIHNIFLNQKNTCL